MILAEALVLHLEITPADALGTILGVGFDSQILACKESTHYVIILPY